MTKRHFIELANVLRRTKPDTRILEPKQAEFVHGQMDTWRTMRNMLGDFCASQNPRFNRERWLGYIAGENGPNGGAVKAL